VEKRRMEGEKCQPKKILGKRTRGVWRSKGDKSLELKESWLTFE
jgi:hypothetical protein